MVCLFSLRSSRSTLPLLRGSVIYFYFKYITLMCINLT
nr:MAG TPA: hypothetical protein [Caudoviricetes sp.]